MSLLDLIKYVSNLQSYIIIITIAMTIIIIVIIIIIIIIYTLLRVREHSTENRRFSPGFLVSSNNFQGFARATRGGDVNIDI